MGTKHITIDYKPRNWAKELHNSDKRWMTLVLHRRAGKTTAVLNHLQRSATTIPASEYAYIAPTYKQAKRIAWKMIKHYSADIPGIDYNESELIVKYPNKSNLSLYGSDNVDALRGIGLWGCALDENSQQPPGLFGEVISKCLADHLGYCIWLGTPKGKNRFHKTYQTAKNNPDRYFSSFKTIDDSLRDEVGETIDNLRISLEDDRQLVKDGEMTQDEFDQEWYCSFEAAIKGAYYSNELAQLRTSGRIRPNLYDEAIPVHTVWDLGVGSQLAIGFYQRSGNTPVMIDCWVGSQSDGIKQAIKMLKDQKPYIYGKHFAPHDVNAREISTGKTRLQTALALGIDFQVVPKLGVAEGIDKGKLFFSRLYVDEKNCEDWLDAMPQYKQHFDESRNVYIDKPYHDWTSHYADVHRYAAVVEKEMTNDVEAEWREPDEVPEEYEGTQDATPTRIQHMEKELHAEGDMDSGVEGLMDDDDRGEPK